MSITVPRPRQLLDDNLSLGLGQKDSRIDRSDACLVFADVRGGTVVRCPYEKTKLHGDAYAEKGGLQ